MGDGSLGGRLRRGPAVLILTCRGEGTGVAGEDQLQGARLIGPPAKEAAKRRYIAEERSAAGIQPRLRSGGIG